MDLTAEEMQELMKVLKETSTPVDMGVRLLAYKLRQEKYLFLWWD